MRFYAPEKIGLTRRRTPEGFLVCESVPIARTGTMFYADGEVPVSSGQNGIVRVERDEETVFDEQTIASFYGKPITLGHPPEDVNPDNWSTLAKGTIHEPRRGTGEFDDCLVADLFITDAGAIKAVLDGLDELSCGYDADYEQIAPGHGRQTNIIGNHVALLENGRCGSRCSIGDAAMGQKTSLKDTLMGLFSSRRTVDEQIEKALNEALEQGDDTSAGGETHVHVHFNGSGASEPAEKEQVPSTDEGEEQTDPIEERFTRIEQAITALADTVAKLVAGEQGEENAPDEEMGPDQGNGSDEEEKTEDEDVLEEGKDEEEATRTTDAASLAGEIADTKARAEILAPGIKFPTFDAKADPKTTRDGLCGLRRKALLAAKTGDSADLVAPLLGGDIRKMTCDAVSAAFIGASELVSRSNNARVIGREKATRDKATGRAPTNAEINEANRQFWSTRS
jgi:hypothetical protein